MKHGNGIRFATTGPALRRDDRVRECAATALFVVARACLPSRFAVSLATASAVSATAARPAGNHSLAASAATFARAIASAVPHAACRTRSPGTALPSCGVARFPLFALS
ncbi:hypothetical protein [Burkholderia sp. AU15512]|uniref:hypothetical protein n=1 Tax=Burkholderia sp. AU15512 TaxID=2015345 RepID=UPI00211AE573|nr:hypothetical protein [Burkholderia sp. AU15512]